MPNTATFAERLLPCGIQLDRQQQRIRLLEEQILLMRDKHFARSSEQSPGQYGIFDEAEDVSEADLRVEKLSEIPSNNTSKPRKKTSGRRALPADLPRVRREYDLSAEQKPVPAAARWKPLVKTSANSLASSLPAQPPQKSTQLQAC